MSTRTKTPRYAKVHTSCAMVGFQGRRAKYRIAWSLDPDLDPASDGRRSAFRAAVKAGKAGIEYVRGAEARDYAETAAEAKVADFERAGSIKQEIAGGPWRKAAVAGLRAIRDLEAALHDSGSEEGR